MNQFKRSIRKIDDHYIYSIKSDPFGVLTVEIFTDPNDKDKIKKVIFIGKNTNTFTIDNTSTSFQFTNLQSLFPGIQMDDLRRLYNEIQKPPFMEDGSLSYDSNTVDIKEAIDIYQHFLKDYIRFIGGGRRRTKKTKKRSRRSSRRKSRRY